MMLSAVYLFLVHVVTFLVTCRLYPLEPMVIRPEFKTLDWVAARNTLFFTFPLCLFYTHVLYRPSTTHVYPWVYYLVFYVLVAETSFYFIHRLFHIVPYLYKTYHARHHVWTHPVSRAALDTHPVDHVFINLLPLLLGPTLWPPVSFTVVYLWVMMSTYHAVYTHSYPLTRSWGQRLHVLHHVMPRYNFGIYGFWDALLGTLFVGH